MTEAERICACPFPAVGTLRVYQAEYEPVEGHVSESSSPLFWSRFESHAATHYSATLREVAFKDALAEFRYLEGALASMSQSDPWHLSN